MGFREKAFWDCTEFIMRFLKEAPKVGKGRDLGDLGRTKYGK